MHHIRQVKVIQEELSEPYEQNVNKAVFGLLRGLSRELDEKPELYHIEREGVIWALFPRSCFLAEDLMREYAAPAGLASGIVPITLRGITEENEVGEIRAQIRDGGVEITKSNVSGRDYDSLSDICIRLTPGNKELCTFLWDTVLGADLRKSCIVIPNRWKAFAMKEDLIDKNTMSYFGYLSMEEYVDTEEYLVGLSVDQMSELWLQYLEEGSSPLEFDWLLESMKQGTAFNLIGWELSLRLTTERLHITIKNESTGFSVVDGNGTLMKFDYESLFAAEKVFLKILFPAAPVS